MRPCEVVIVTINLTGFNTSYDMELPTFMRVDDLKKKLRETLRLMDIRRFIAIGEIGLSHNGKSLRDNDTLAGCGIWDGSIIEITTS